MEHNADITGEMPKLLSLPIIDGKSFQFEMKAQFVSQCCNYWILLDRENAVCRECMKACRIIGWGTGMRWACESHTEREWKQEDGQCCFGPGVPLATSVNISLI